jgi:hypothetical protein
VARDELSCHINRLERSLWIVTNRPLWTRSQKILEVKAHLYGVSKIRLSQALRLGLDKHRHMEGRQGWLWVGSSEHRRLQRPKYLSSKSSGMWRLDYVSHEVFRQGGCVTVKPSIISLRDRPQVYNDALYDMFRTTSSVLHRSVWPYDVQMCAMMNGHCFVCKEQYGAVQAAVLQLTLVN